jgi:hypothetical protein
MFANRFITFVLCMAFTPAAILSGCNSAPKVNEAEVSLKLRSIQTRSYDTTNANNALRVAMATLQDLGFVIDNADADLGTVSATKLDNAATKMTITVRMRGKTQILVRANAQYRLHAVDDPIFYQQFFTAYSKSMFLEAHEVDAAAPGL